MRARFATPTSPRRIVGRFLAVAIALTALGLAPQSASALDFTNFEVTQAGYNQWLLTGSVDAILDIDEHATIDFGGVIAGQSTSTTAGGDFEHYFAAYPGDIVSFTASISTETSPTVSFVVEDPTSGPQP